MADAPKNVDPFSLVSVLSRLGPRAAPGRGESPGRPVGRSAKGGAVPGRENPAPPPRRGGSSGGSLGARGC
jgi:hypothetical protein